MQQTDEVVGQGDVALLVRLRHIGHQPAEGEGCRLLARRRLTPHTRVPSGSSGGEGRVGRDVVLGVIGGVPFSPSTALLTTSRQ